MDRQPEKRFEDYQNVGEPPMGFFRLPIDARIGSLKTISPRQNLYNRVFLFTHDCPL